MNTEKTYSLSLSDADLQVLAKALDEMPFKLAAPLINKINTQITEAVKGNADGMD